MSERTSQVAGCKCSRSHPTDKHFISSIMGKCCSAHKRLKSHSTGQVARTAEGAEQKPETEIKGQWQRGRRGETVTRQSVCECSRALVCVDPANSLWWGSFRWSRAERAPKPGLSEEIRGPHSGITLPLQLLSDGQRSSTYYIHTVCSVYTQTHTHTHAHKDTKHGNHTYRCTS